MRTDLLGRALDHMQRDHHIHNRRGVHSGSDDLTGTEQAIFERLPKLPATAEIGTNRIWIIDWLSSDDEPAA